MAYSAHLPGSSGLVRNEIVDIPSPGGLGQKSCYSYVEKLAGVTNPVGLQTDVIYPNALAAVFQSGEEGVSSGQPVAFGCKGHSIDNEFPLEPKTPFALPFVMFPTLTDGSKHHEADLCAMPVLNWEEYIHKVRPCRVVRQKSSQASKVGAEDEIEEVPLTDPLFIPEDEEPDKEKNNIENVELEPAPERVIRTPDGRRWVKNVAPKYGNRDFRDVLIGSQRTHDIEESPKERAKRLRDSKGSQKFDHKQAEKVLSSAKCKPTKFEWNKLPTWCMSKLKNIPEFRVEGTWNYLFGGYNGACCFMRPGASTKTPVSDKLHLYVGKGSLLRDVELDRASPASMNSYVVHSMWEEDEDSLPFNKRSTNHHPYNDLIFQILPNEKFDMLAVRRGKSVQIYSTEEGRPYLLESIPNTRYGTEEYFYSARNIYVSDPLITGMDLNPIFYTQLVTIDENCIVRFCDIGEGTTTDQFILPRKIPYVQTHRPKGYPCFKVNEAVGVAFAYSSNLFYGWCDSVVYRGDRRDRSISRSHLFPLLDVRNDVQMQAISGQDFFHDDDANINEYVSCVRRSSQDPYYYVGTTSKIYLMDHRVPSHPVLKVSHGLQSPIAYMDIFSDSSFETVVASSQRLPETVCMITDKAHTSCAYRPGCKAKNPILHCYPSHLSNSRSSFDFATKQGHGFSFPNDYDLIKNHHYAWTTGVAAYPIGGPSDPKLPKGIIVATSNNFGDIFYQEWSQKPLLNFKKIGPGDYKLHKFLEEWNQAVMPKEHGIPKPSKNKKNSVDCSILLEPLAREIRRLPRIRDHPFNCFKPHAMQYESNLKTLIPMTDLLFKLSNYKGDRVKGMLEVWKMKDISKHVPTPDEATEAITIKEEAPEVEGSVSNSSIHTIDIDNSEHEEVYTQEHLQQLTNIASDIAEAVNVDGMEDYEDYLIDPLQSEHESDDEDEEQSKNLKREPKSEFDGPSPEDHAQTTDWLSLADDPDEQYTFLNPQADRLSSSQYATEYTDITQSLFDGSQELFPDDQNEPGPSTSSSQRMSRPRLSTKKKGGFL